jgi:ferrous iron transport protein A
MKQHFEATLADVKPGYTAIISGFNEDQIPLKMLEMGLLPGNVVLVKRYSPFGDPMHIRVAGFDMALRLDEAAYVHVDAATITPEKAA